MGETRFIMGLISEQRIVNEKVQSMNEVKVVQHQLGLAVVVQARYIKETIDLLPSLD